MDILYSLRRKHIASNRSMNDFDCLHEGVSLCCISVKNIVAFSMRTELDDTSGKTYGSHVYVADLNTPWHSYKVTSTNGAVTSLEWDSSGEKLLVATDGGSVSIWSSRDHVLNSWIYLGGTTFSGEAIISAAFFHPGRKISIVAEKKDSPLYSEKMNHIKFSPSVRCFGGSGAEGCLLITGTGIAGAVALDREGRIFTKCESLALTRAALSVADIAHGKNGEFVVAVSNSDVCRVQCYRVSVILLDERLHITSQALPSFFLHSFNSNKHHPFGKVSGLKFVTREDADSLVVSANTQSGGLVEVWQLTERAVPVHRVFQPVQPPPETFKTVAWQYECSYTTSHSVTCVTTNKIALTTAAPPPSYVLVATSDSNVHCLYRDNLKSVGTRSLACAWFEDTAKHQRLCTQITHMDLTWLGCALVVVDSHGQLYLFKVPPILEPGVSMTVNVASALLDYCLVSGTDSWDVLVSLQSSIVDAIADRISDNFNKQPQAVQQYYYTAHLQMRMALARLTANGQAKAAELNSLLMLHAVSTAFTSLLRPSDLSSHEKGPADSVASLLNENQNSDIDKVLIHLECKEFTMEPSNLQSLQQLIQWTADLALNILARLPEQYKSPAGDCLKDVKAINTLRSLLVIIRVWGLLRPTCLPMFVKSAENLDVLLLLFKLLSKLAQGHEPEENLLDECCLLPSQVMIPQVNPTTPIVCIASPLLPYQTFPIQLEYGVEPDCLMFEPENTQLEGCLATDQSLDTIRHLYLGKQPFVVKQCCRCGGKTQVQLSTPRTAAIRAWDQRWLRSCRCGGSWRIHKYI
ncbi:mediator of RNA polymerase II transcription subunit 16 [Halyomorpha halys]|uniref:mediator of RNA polymerase II transcription subunit 16 n=1 Tax=Halyomorpha halys TaxID=286706 RepID=UPI0006D515AD|nr:mediator of RNA polymerase II transcription subunit 16 [Halyomorpha halys]